MGNNAKSIIRRMKSKYHVPLLLDKMAWRDSLLRLRPVTRTMEDARRMAMWRNAHATEFFTWIRPTPEEVLEWLGVYEYRQNDVLFIIESFEGSAWGQIGLYRIDVHQGTAELGRLIRGEDAPDGMMIHAAQVVLEWAFDQIGLHEVCLEVFEDNLPAIALYRRLGFLRIDSFPVRKSKENGKAVRWIPLERGQNGFDGPRKMICRMAIDRQRFRSLTSKRSIEMRKTREDGPEGRTAEYVA